MELSRNLLFAQEVFDPDFSLESSPAKGTYSTMQFVLRLRDDIRAALSSKEIDGIYLQAQSTIIHENIHWWQHVGSNFGFLFSLAYPAFIHASYPDLRKLPSLGLAYKSLIKFDEAYYTKHEKADIPELNLILNNYYDFEYAKKYALDHRNFFEIEKDHRFFLSIGHCYHIFWSITIETIASSLDKTFQFLPKTNPWVRQFQLLASQEAPGFSPNSMYLSRIGVKAIYEGQAMFNQMQYLTAVLNPELTYRDFEEAGMLYGIYAEAFDHFLRITKLSKPNDLLDPVVALFLLVCDLSINPTNGFPIDIYDFENFIVKNDPGIRFETICMVIAEDAGSYVKTGSSYSKDAYVSLSKMLSDRIGCKCPYESIPAVLAWSKEQEVAKLLEEEIHLRFSPENLPIRMMFSKYYRFQEDKLKYPHVFCWFGYHAHGKNPNIDIKSVDSLYKKHHALFMDDPDGEIKASIFEGRTEENISYSFNMFYAFNILYDLTLKWVYEPGNFTFDYKWLVNERNDQFIPLIKNDFKKHYGIEIDNITVL